MNAERFKEAIAERLKRHRRERGLSLDATARATGVSKAMLGQIERQESSPTIAVLWKIATGLGVSFSAFFAEGPRPLAQDETFPEDPHMRIRVVFPYCPDTRLEVFEVTLSAWREQRSEPHHAGVIEHIVALAGELEVLRDGAWRALAPGQALRFHADQPHGYRAVSEVAVFQNIICYT